MPLGVRVIPETGTANANRGYEQSQKRVLLMLIGGTSNPRNGTDEPPSRAVGAERRAGGSNAHVRRVLELRAVERLVQRVGHGRRVALHDREEVLELVELVLRGSSATDNRNKGTDNRNKGPRPRNRCLSLSSSCCAAAAPAARRARSVSARSPPKSVRPSVGPSQRTARAVSRGPSSSPYAVTGTGAASSEQAALVCAQRAGHACVRACVSVRPPASCVSAGDSVCVHGR